MPARKSSRRSMEPPAVAAPAPSQDMKPGVLITFRADQMKSAVSSLKESAGMRNFAFAADFEESAADLSQMEGGDALVFNSLGVAVMDTDPDQLSAVSALVAGETAILAVEPEPIFFAFDERLSADRLAYLRGFRDAADFLYQTLTGTTSGQGFPDLGVADFQDTANATWGLAATRALDSRLTGRGVRVAVLDTGLDLDHPDFRGRAVTSRSFIGNQDVQDENGHGTHCIGTACGSRQPSNGTRYGVAFESEIFAGKVLTNHGFNLGRSTIAGIEWAIANRCDIVSLSLGEPVRPGVGHLVAFENLAREALRRNTLIIAAAGNDSRRGQGVVSPVASPANCPSIMAVAAVDRFLRVADFSNAARNPDARIDIAAPGVDVLSSAPDPAPPPQPPFFRQWRARHDTISGTSMATPHVSGIAALLRQENPNMAASDLWRLLISKARALPLSVSDVGAGLVQA